MSLMRLESPHWVIKRRTASSGVGRSERAAALPGCVSSGVEATALGRRFLGSKAKRRGSAAGSGRAISQVRAIGANFKATRPCALWLGPAPAACETVIHSSLLAVGNGAEVRLAGDGHFVLCALQQQLASGRLTGTQAAASGQPQVPSQPGATSPPAPLPTARCLYVIFYTHQLRTAAHLPPSAALQSCSFLKWGPASERR